MKKLLCFAILGFQGKDLLNQLPSESSDLDDLRVCNLMSDDGKWDVSKMIKCFDKKKLRKFWLFLFVEQ